ncbi:cytochrome P450 [Sistotremastrum suecicum HHB10207 ss-3]|uniref:Cytochrome P450 n=1 Tax=Sistotremastrum suecicum HHB10207 ss-3 TaxID=1314776 RepID=A0A166FZT3_9AGAM|nr:cytochrome P450 [Sistotremastrum suecicum HHB10207 ss-3]
MFSFQSSLELLVLAGFAAVVLVLAFRFGRRNESALPPGPVGHWLLGNEIPKPYAWRKFTEYTKQYGPVFSLRLGRQILVVIGTYQAAVDVMEKQGALLADRPRSIAAGEILSGGKRTLLVQQGERLKRLRKALHGHLQPKVAVNYEPLQAKAALIMIMDILRDPQHFQDHAKKYAASVIMTLTYGKTSPTSYSDPEVQMVNECTRRLGTVVKPGAWAVDSWPILRYVPGYLSVLNRHHREELALFRGQLDNVRNQMTAGTAQSSFAKELIERQVEYGLSDDEAAYLCGSLFGAGSDTTAAAIAVVIMAAASFPELQTNAQKQLDMVVGADRTPTFNDREELPYIDAFVLESFRWRPISSGGFAHRATEDIIYNGYLIPKGATVIGNHWSIARDPDVFPDPEAFRPERWLTPEGTIREDLRFYNFGFGRRVCPGQHLANRSLYINTANLLWAFKIMPDPTRPIDTLAFTDTANSHPLPFQVKFESRNPNVFKTVKAALEQM